LRDQFVFGNQKCEELRADAVRDSFLDQQVPFPGQ